MSILLEMGGFVSNWVHLGGAPILRRPGEAGEKVPNFETMDKLSSKEQWGTGHNILKTAIILNQLFITLQTSV